MKQGKWTRITAVLFAAAMLLSLSACGDTPPATGNPTTTTSTTTTTTAEETTTTTAETTADTTTTTTKKPTTITPTTATNVTISSYPVYWAFKSVGFANGQKLNVTISEEVLRHDFKQYCDGDDPSIAIVNNTTQLNEFKQQLVDGSSQTTLQVDKEFQKYDAAYFKGNSLVLVFYPFTSSTFRGEVTALVRQGNEAYVEWTYFVPYDNVVTDDWCPRYTIVEVKSADIDGVKTWGHIRNLKYPNYAPNTKKTAELSEQQKEEIVTDFANYLWYEEEWRQYESLEKTAQSCYVRSYFGTYNGYVALTMDVGFGPAMATEIHLAGGYYFWADGSEYYYLYRDGKFFSFSEAYTAKWITAKDLRDIWYYSHGGRYPVLGPDSVAELSIPSEELAGKKYCSATIQDDFMEGELIVGMGKTLSAIDRCLTIQELSDLLGISIESARVFRYDYTTYVLSLPTKTKQAVLDAMKKAEACPAVRYAEPNYIVYCEPCI